MKKFLFIFFALALASCAKQHPPVTDTGDTFIINMQESDKSELLLKVRTKKIYGCRNYIIERNVSVAKDQIKVHFTGMTKPDICLTALGPAQTTINLGVLENGEYPLNMLNGTMDNQFRLVVTDDAYRVYPLSDVTGNVIFEDKELVR